MLKTEVSSPGSRIVVTAEKGKPVPLSPSRRPSVEQRAAIADPKQITFSLVSSSGGAVPTITTVRNEMREADEPAAR